MHESFFANKTPFLLFAHCMLPAHSAEIGRMIAEWSAALKETLLTGALTEYRSLRDRMSLLLDLRRQVCARWGWAGWAEFGGLYVLLGG
jgi:hypothetical protein